MKRVFQINVIAILLLFAAGLAASAQGRGRISDPGLYCGNIAGLTEQQKTELITLAEKHRAEMDLLRKERQAATDREAWYAAGEKMRVSADKHRFDVLNVLTPEQRETFRFRQAEFNGPAGRDAGRGMAFAPGRGAGRAMMTPGMRGGGRGRRW